MTVVPAVTKVLLGSLALSNASIDETILRSVGVIGARSDQLAASEDVAGAFGIIQVTNQALAAGVALMPGLVTDVGDDGWFTYVPMSLGIFFGTAIGFDMQSMTQYHFDSKAKRRVEEGQSLAFIVENGSAANGMAVALAFRLLS